MKKPLAGAQTGRPGLASKAGEDCTWRCGLPGRFCFLCVCPIFGFRSHGIIPPAICYSPEPADGSRLRQSALPPLRREQPRRAAVSLDPPQYASARRPWSGWPLLSEATDQTSMRRFEQKDATKIGNSNFRCGPSFTACSLNVSYSVGAGSPGSTFRVSGDMAPWAASRLSVSPRTNSIRSQ